MTWNVRPLSHPLPKKKNKKTVISWCITFCNYPSFVQRVLLQNVCMTAPPRRVLKTAILRRSRPVGLTGSAGDKRHAMVCHRERSKMSLNTWLEATEFKYWLKPVLIPAPATPNRVSSCKWLKPAPRTHYSILLGPAPHLKQQFVDSLARSC